MPIRRVVSLLAAAFALLTPAVAAAQQPPEGRTSILQFIPQSEWAAIRACRSTYDVTAAKEQADTAVSISTGDYTVGNGEVDWPAGCYNGKRCSSWALRRASPSRPRHSHTPPCAEEVVEPSDRAV